MRNLQSLGSSSMLRSWSSGKSLIAAAAICWGVFSATAANANTITITPLPGVGGNEATVDVTCTDPAVCNLVGLVAGPPPAGSTTDATGFGTTNNAETTTLGILNGLAGGTVFALAGTNTAFDDLPNATGDSEDGTFTTTAEFFAIKSAQWVAFFYNPTGDEITIHYEADGTGEGSGAGLSHFLAFSAPNPGTFCTSPELCPTGVPGPAVGAGLPALLAACGFLIAFARRRRQLTA